ncbi:MAG: hypothetical protein D6780_03800 [Candidatus Dadabacteria bacterium]|nr:MAG: hypothetical protein D6780_03800 [Candidatus Dadabacteria bacterium]
MVRVEIITQISSLLSSGKVNVGSKAVEKDVLFGRAKAILIAKGSNELIKERLIYLAELAKLPCFILDLNTKEMGEKFGKAYAVSAVSVIDAGNSKILEAVKK